MDPKTHHNALDPNDRLLWYEIKSILGQGGFGITYLAYDTNLKHQVAIKEYLPVQFSTRDASKTVQPISENQSEIFRWGLQRFLEEAQTLARFKHPNIIRVHSFFEHNNTGYIVMDFEKGIDLETLIDKGEHFGEQRLLGILMPILDGLEQIHNAGIIHRDIKPANILIRDDNSPVLLDFGSARHAIGNQTKTITSLVTPGYAPFEQYHQAEGRQGPWTDIYALGATCYCAITGKPPPDALKRGMVQFEHNLDVYLELADIKAGKYSPHLLAAIDCAQRFKERDRPQSISEWQQMLTGAQPVPGAQAVQEAGMESPPAQKPSAKAPPEKARDRGVHPVRSALRYVSALGLLVAMGWYGYVHQQDISFWINARIDEFKAEQLAKQQQAEEARRQELVRQEVLKEQIAAEAKVTAQEQRKLEQLRREQRKKELEAELAQLELESAQAGGQSQAVEIERLQKEKERLAEIATQEAEQRKREELARQEAERKLEVELQRLEQEKKRLAELQKLAEEAAQKQAEAQRLAELARQREAQVHEVEQAEKRASLARLEAQQIRQTDLASTLVDELEMTGLSTEAAVERLRESLLLQTGQQEQVIDDAVLDEIVRQKMEQLRAEEAARLKAENLTVAKRLLQLAQEFYSTDRLEEALINYRNAYDLGASVETRDTALQGIIATMAQLYADGNSEVWQLLMGNSNKNLGGEYNGTHTIQVQADGQEISITASTIVAHKDGQLTMVAVDEGIVMIANIVDGKGDLSFHDTKNDIHGTGTIVVDSFDFALGIEWSNAEGSITGSWQLQNQKSLWHIDLNGEYIARLTNTDVRVFRRKTFNFTLTDLTTPASAGNSNDIVGISEDGNIKLTGQKIAVNRIKFEFITNPNQIEGNGWFEVSDVHGDLLEGAWEVQGFSFAGSSGDWVLQKVQLP